MPRAQSSGFWGFSCGGVESREGLQGGRGTLGALGALPPSDFEDEKRSPLGAGLEMPSRCRRELWQQRGSTWGLPEGRAGPELRSLSPRSQ